MQQTLALLSPRFTVLICTLFLMVGCTMGCDLSVFSGKKAKKYEGEVALALPYDPLSLDPLGPDWARQSGLIKQLFPQLVIEAHQTGAGPDYTPYLATAWETDDAGQSLTLTLNSKAKWSDGKRITVQDVKSSLLMQKDPPSPWPLAEKLAAVSTIEILGDDQLTIRFSSPQVDPLAVVNHGVILPAHVFESRKSETEGPWLRVTGGAFRVRGAKRVFKEGRQRYPTGLPVLLEPSPHCLEGLCPKLAEVTLSFEPQGEVRADGFFKGTVDYLPGVPAQSIEKIGKMKAHHFVSVSDGTFSMITWNTQVKPFDDADVRRALTQAIDRQALVDGLLHGAGKVVSVPISENGPARPTHLSPLKYDPKGAVEGLKAKGIEDLDGDGWLEVGEDLFQIELIRSEGSKLNDELSLRIREDLRKIGIQVVLKTMSGEALLKQGMGGKFEALLLNWKVEDPFDLSLFSQNRGPQSANFSFYQNDDLNAKMAAIADAKTQTEFQAAFVESMTHIHQAQPMTLLFERLRIDGMESDIVGGQPGFEPYRDLHLWERVKESVPDTQ